jgi:uncharacterized protein YjbJ (UPF0337 family)
MDKAIVIGTIDEVLGHAKRAVGELTGDATTFVDGTALELKGEIEVAQGKQRDDAREAAESAAKAHEKELAAQAHASEIVRANTPVICEIP